VDRTRSAIQPKRNRLKANRRCSASSRDPTVWNSLSPKLRVRMQGESQHPPPLQIGAALWRWTRGQELLLQHLNRALGCAAAVLPAGNFQFGRPVRFSYHSECTNCRTFSRRGRSIDHDVELTRKNASWQGSLFSRGANLTGLSMAQGAQCTLRLKVAAHGRR